MKNLLPGWLLIIIFSLLYSPVYGDGLEPEIRRTKLASLEAESNTGVFTFLATQMVNFHRNVISKVDGDRCKMKPTCSSYAKKAFKEYGFIRGSLLMVDRMLHEGDEYKVSPVVRSGEKLVTYDPVENNVFWWQDKQLKNRE